MRASATRVPPAPNSRSHNAARVWFGRAQQHDPLRQPRTGTDPVPIHLSGLGLLDDDADLATRRSPIRLDADRTAWILRSGQRNASLRRHRGGPWSSCTAAVGSVR
jgi:hypothetical protein